jgi:hypothetical protein
MLAAPRAPPVDPLGEHAFASVDPNLMEALVSGGHPTAGLRKLLKAAYAGQVDVAAEWRLLKRAVVALPWRAKATTTLWGISLKPDVKTLGRLRREALALGLAADTEEAEGAEGAMDAVTAALVEREATVRGWCVRPWFHSPRLVDTRESITLTRIDTLHGTGLHASSEGGLPSNCRSGALKPPVISCEQSGLASSVNWGYNFGRLTSALHYLPALNTQHPCTGSPA